MPVRGFVIVCVFVALACGAYFGPPALAQTQMMPSMSAPPQQMTASSVPANYPATYPSTYPSTAPTGWTPPTLPPYDRTPATLTASTANGPGNPGPAIIGQSGGAPVPNNPGPLYEPYGSPDAMTAGRQVDHNNPADASNLVEPSVLSDEPWTWQVVPTGLMYRSYLAGNHEPRLGSQLVHDRNLGWL
jgi:hypothetical protein